MNRFSEDRIEYIEFSDKHRRKIHIWEPDHPKTIFLAVHGVLAHGGDYVTPALYFRQHGIATIAHDLCGHDNQKIADIPQFEVFLDDLELMMKWIGMEYPQIPVFIIAHSAGALIATHYGLKETDSLAYVKGFVFSSPYYVNAIKTPPVLEKVVGVLSALFPKMKVPLEDITLHLTRDLCITGRHFKDNADHTRASGPSARLANELLKAQRKIPGMIGKWQHPLYCIVAGNDRVADKNASLEYLGKVDSKWMNLEVQEENYHENFNELNREEIFTNILNWISMR